MVLALGLLMQRPHVMGCGTIYDREFAVGGRIVGWVSRRGGRGPGTGDGMAGYGRRRDPETPGMGSAQPLFPDQTLGGQGVYRGGHAVRPVLKYSAI